VASIEIGGTPFRAWSQGEIGSLRQIRLITKGLNGFTPEEVITLSRMYTPGLRGRMDYLRTDHTSDGGDVFVFGIDDTNAHALAHQKDPWVLSMGTDSRRVQYSGKQALIGRAEEAGLANRMEEVSVEEENLESS
jgi:hypothetical protein